MIRSRWIPLSPLIATMFALAAGPAHGQAVQTSPANQLLATRDALQAELARLSGSRAAQESDGRLLARIRARLQNGDFRPGDRVVLEVIGEPALTDTFTVTGERMLRLPPPTTEPMALTGVLRSEIEQHARTYFERFLYDPVVRAHSLVRLSVSGAVVRGGFHGLPPGAALSQVLVAAGGTTPDADMDELRVDRDGETILENDELRDAFARGLTIDEAYLRDGDQVIVESQDGGGFEDNLRFVWVLVSLAGGIYGLSRAF